MSRKVSRLIVLILVLSIFITLNDVLAKNKSKKITEQELITLNSNLKKRAEQYCDAFERRSFKDIYKFINTRYRREVPEDLYIDFIEFPGYTDSYFKVEVISSAVLRTGRHGVTVMQITVYNYKKELISQKYEDLEWILEKGDWYKIEKLQ